MTWEEDAIKAAADHISFQSEDHIYRGIRPCSQCGHSSQTQMALYVAGARWERERMKLRDSIVVDPTPEMIAAIEAQGKDPAKVEFRVTPPTTGVFGGLNRDPKLKEALLTGDWLGQDGEIEIKHSEAIDNQPVEIVDLGTVDLTKK